MVYLFCGWLLVFALHVVCVCCLFVRMLVFVTGFTMFVCFAVFTVGCIILLLWVGDFVLGLFWYFLGVYLHLLEFV